MYYLYRNIIALCSCLSIFFLCSISAEAETFVYCSEGSPSTFNPQLATDGPSIVASANTIYDRLLAFRKEDAAVIPALAESWKLNKSGTRYTFKLRKGVKFHTTPYFSPTREFNADDVLFTFNRQRLPNHLFHKVGGGNYAYYTGMGLNKLIKDIVKTDDYTVSFILNYPSSPFLSVLAMHFSSILSAEYGAKLQKEEKKENMAIQPIGTGPFVFHRYIKDTNIRYRAHPNYWQGKAKLDKIVFQITPDASVRSQKLKGGECHLVTMPALMDIDSIKKDSRFIVKEKDGLNIGYLAMNVEKKPLDNVLVRRAINHALNRDSYIEAIYLGRAVKAKNPIPPLMWSYNDKINDYAYDLAKAKKLLKEAGYENGFSIELWTLPISRPYNPSGKKMGEMMQADLAKVGIKVKLVTYDWPTYLKKMDRGEHQLIQLGWSGDNGDPDNFLNILLSCSSIKTGSNSARWCYKPFDDIVNKARRIRGRAKRELLYRKAQEIFKENAPWVTLAHAKVYRMMSKRVKNFNIRIIGDDQFYEVFLTK